MYTPEQLKKLMLIHLKNFGVYSSPPTRQTVFETVLPNDDGYGTATSRRLFKGTVIRDLINNGHDSGHSAKWPRDWVGKNIDTLAPKLLGEKE